MPHILSQLPASLDETYARVLKEIGATNQIYAHRLLQCLTVAKRPLFVRELAEILAFDFDGAKEGIPELKENWRWKNEQEAVLSTCSSLISVVDGVVQFSHFSVKEFLTSDRLATSSTNVSHFHILPEPAHAVIVKACLGILLQSEHGNGNAMADRHSPLSFYADRYWEDHARFEKVWTGVEGGIRRLFDPAKPHLEAWLRWRPTSRVFHSFGHDNGRGSSLYYASLCGLYDLAAHLVAENPQHVTGLVGRDPSPLVAALCNGQLHVADLLYQHGALADLGIRNEDNMTLLHVALEEGHVHVVKWLLDHGVPENSQPENHETRLNLAEVSGDRRHGITVNTADGFNYTPLHWASQGGHSAIVQQLLMRGADVTSKNQAHRTPLHLASYSGDAETMRLLIGHGSDVTAQDRRHRTPLHLASYHPVGAKLRHS